AEGLTFGGSGADGDANANSGRRTAKFDLTVNITASSSGYELEWEYARELFREASITRMAARFEQLMGEATSAPDKRLGELACMTDEEQELVLTSFNDTMTD